MGTCDQERSGGSCLAFNELRAREIGKLAMSHRLVTFPSPYGGLGNNGFDLHSANRTKVMN